MTALVRVPATLTRRELEVMELVAEGCPNAEIAKRLYMATPTVANRVHTVMSLLGARSRGHAAGILIGEGTIPPPKRAEPFLYRSALATRL